MRQLVRRFTRGDEGAGLTEYALILALVAICLIGIIQLARNAIGDTVNTAAADVSHRSATSYGARRISKPLPALGTGSAAPTDPEEEPPTDSTETSPDR